MEAEAQKKVKFANIENESPLKLKIIRNPPPPPPIIIRKTTPTTPTETDSTFSFGTAPKNSQKKPKPKPKSLKKIGGILGQQLQQKQIQNIGRIVRGKDGKFYKSYAEAKLANAIFNSESASASALAPVTAAITSSPADSFFIGPLSNKVGEVKLQIQKCINEYKEKTAAPSGGRRKTRKRQKKSKKNRTYRTKV